MFMFECIIKEWYLKVVLVKLNVDVFVLVLVME